MLEADFRTVLTNDIRPIIAVYLFGENAGGWVIEQGGITKIEPYCENGEHSMIPWIAVYIDDQIFVRIPANQVSIHSPAVFFTRIMD